MSHDKASSAGAWFVSTNGQRFGPYAAEALSAWIATGRVSDRSTVSNGGPWISTREFMRQQAASMAAVAGSALPPGLDLEVASTSSSTKEGDGSARPAPASPPSIDPVHPGQPPPLPGLPPLPPQDAA